MPQAMTPAPPAGLDALLRSLFEGPTLGEQMPEAFRRPSAEEVMKLGGGMMGATGPIGGTAGALPRLFSDPRLARIFQRAAESPIVAGAGVRRPSKQDVNLMDWLRDAFEVQRVQSTGPGAIENPTFLRNLVSSGYGQTFGKGGIVPFTGAMEKVAEPLSRGKATGALTDESTLLTALLHGMLFP